MKKFRIFIAISFIIIFYTNLFSQELHLYGGDNNNKYLGCLTCNEYNSDSIWNEFGTYGSPFNLMSIWNEFGIYGSPFSIYSPWNDFSINPPVIVDKLGNFYGYLSTNEFKDKRATFDLALFLYKYHDLIKKDISKWYNEIF